MASVLRNNLNSGRDGVFSLCSAHPLAIEAGLNLARERRQIAVIEATSNQVNQDGGYTGMRPQDFADRVFAIARKIGLGADRIVLGGDHLGPQPWRKGDAETALHKAGQMVAEYVQAGFTKIHLDCSMSCADDPAPLPEKEIANRAAMLASFAEKAAAETGATPLYIIGTEVPPPGGMGAGHDIVPTAPGHVKATWRLHEQAFADAGMSRAFDRVIGMVVQPGLDFGNETVVRYDPASSRALSETVTQLNGAVFEAHSTDYQLPRAYADLIAGHFAILKVGPAATFAMREALYALEAIEAELVPLENRSGLRAAIEQAMCEQPDHWTGHYQGDAHKLAYLQHFSLSDRLRYYWTAGPVKNAFHTLLANLDAHDLTYPLISQYLPQLAPDVANGTLCATARTLVIANIGRALSPYADASDPHFTD